MRVELNHFYKWSTKSKTYRFSEQKKEGKKKKKHVFFLYFKQNKKNMFFFIRYLAEREKMKFLVGRINGSRRKNWNLKRRR
jgi:hypothetical protein